MLLIFRVDWCADLIRYCGDWTNRDSVFASKDGKEDGMDAPGFASPIRAYKENLCQMWQSNDPIEAEPTYLDSLGVLDLDISLCPDAFGLRAFDRTMPITRMGGPRSTGGWSWRSIEPSALSRMAGSSGLGLAAGNEPRTLVRHVIQRPSYEGGNAATQRRMSHANELGHS